MEELLQKYRDSAISFDEYRDEVYEYAIRILKTEKHFQISRYLGVGTYGDVVSAVTPDSDSEVAVKVTCSLYTATGELNSWPKFQHRNVLKLLEVIQLQYVDVFVTPLMKTDLYDISRQENIRGSPTGLDMVRKWLRDTLQGLDYLHSQKVCHLDVKADNVLIDFDMTALLCDFSFIEETDNPVSCYGLLFTYRPPETCPSLGAEIPVDGVKFDVWAFGVLVMNVLTKHSVLLRANDDFKDWCKEIFPHLCSGLSANRFCDLMRKSFPSSNITAEVSGKTLNLIEFVMRINPEDRPSLPMIMEHPFFGGADVPLEDSKSDFRDVEHETEVNVLKNSFSHEGQKQETLAVEDAAKTD